MTAREGAASFRGREEKPSEAITLHSATFSGSQAAQIQVVNKQTQLLPLPPSVPTNQLRRRDFGGRR